MDAQGGRNQVDQRRLFAYRSLTEESRFLDVTAPPVCFHTTPVVSTLQHVFTIFGDFQFDHDEPPLVYLVAPTLRVHPSFETLAQCISSEIEIYRFDINEDWRSGVRVMRRKRANA